MDRFLDDGDSGQGDFVRREYSLALRLGQNIVPFCTKFIMALCLFFCCKIPNVNFQCRSSVLQL